VQAVQIEAKVEGILLQQQKIDQDDESTTLDIYFISHITEFAVLQTVNQLKKELKMLCVILYVIQRVEI
jgi:hypothetical protein